MQHSNNSDTNTLLNNVELADLLGVSKGAITNAKKRGNRVCNLELSDIAVYDKQGSILGFDKEKTLRAIAEKSVRENPGNSEKPGQSKLLSNNPTFDFPELLKTSFPVVTSVLQLENEKVRVPILAMLSAMSLGFLGYVASEDSGSRPIYSLMGALTGAGIYFYAHHSVSAKGAKKQLAEEDRSMLGSKPSASQDGADPKKDEGERKPLSLIPDLPMTGTNMNKEYNLL